MIATSTDFVWHARDEVVNHVLVHRLSLYSSSSATAEPQEFQIIDTPLDLIANPYSPYVLIIHANGKAILCHGSTFSQFCCGRGQIISHFIVFIRTGQLVAKCLRTGVERELGLASDSFACGEHCIFTDTFVIDTRTWVKTDQSHQGRIVCAGSDTDVFVEREGQIWLGDSCLCRAAEPKSVRARRGYMMVDNTVYSWLGIVAQDLDRPCAFAPNDDSLLFCNGEWVALEARAVVASTGSIYSRLFTTGGRMKCIRIF